MIFKLLNVSVVFYIQFCAKKFFKLQLTKRKITLVREEKFKLTKFEIKF